MTDRMTNEKASVINQVNKIKTLTEELDSAANNPSRIRDIASSLHTCCEALEIFASNLPTNYTQAQGQGDQAHHST